MAKRLCKETARFELRCSPEELAAWRAAAKARGVSLSRYIRECLAETDTNVVQNDTKVRAFPQNKTAPQADPALIRQIAAIGNNLNQITRWANAHKSLAEARPVEEEVRRTREALQVLVHVGERPC